MSQLPPRFAFRVARTEAELAAAQALRHRVFVEELGARGGSLTTPGREADRFDAHCRHLLLLDALDNRVVGTTRLMTGEGAAAAGGFASELEFDLGPLRRSGRRLLEVGRTCLLPEVRGGAAMQKLWQGLAAIALEERAGVLFGLASFPGTDPSALALPLAHLAADHLAPEDLRPRSLAPVPAGSPSVDAYDRRRAVLAMPALVKAYLRLGARVGEGAWLDADFACIDVCMVLATETLGERGRALYGPGAA